MLQKYPVLLGVDTAKNLLFVFYVAKTVPQFYNIDMQDVYK